jgi:hypothetical protein
MAEFPASNGKVVGSTPTMDSNRLIKAGVQKCRAQFDSVNLHLINVKG